MGISDDEAGELRPRLGDATAARFTRPTKGGDGGRHRSPGAGRGASGDQLAQLLLEAAQHPRPGLTDGVEVQAQLGGDLGGLPTLHRHPPEGLPRPLLEPPADSLQKAETEHSTLNWIGFVFW
jgi:hypothetical protein